MRTLRWTWFDLLDWFERRGLPEPVTITIVLICLLGIVGALGRLHSDTPAAAVEQPTAALPIIIATAPALPTAEPIQAVAVLPRFVVAYDQPVHGAVLGPIPQPATAAIVARYGADWVMTPWDGGYVWVRAADVGLPDVADIAPTMAPQVVYVASQPQAAPQVVQPVAQPAVPTAPPVWQPPVPTPEVVRAEDFKQPDPQARCAFIGCLPGR